MQELLLAFAKLLPEEQLIESLEQAISKYKAAPSKDTKGELGMYTMLLAARIGTEDKELPEVLSELSERKRIVAAHEFHKY